MKQSVICHKILHFAIFSSKSDGQMTSLWQCHCETLIWNLSTYYNTFDRHEIQIFKLNHQRPKLETEQSDGGSIKSWFEVVVKNVLLVLWLFYRGGLGETALFIMERTRWSCTQKNWCGLGDHALKIFDGDQVIMHSEKVIGTRWSCTQNFW